MHVCIMTPGPSIPWAQRHLFFFLSRESVQEQSLAEVAWSRLVFTGLWSRLRLSVIQDILKLRNKYSSSAFNDGAKHRVRTIGTTIIILIERRTSILTREKSAAMDAMLVLVTLHAVMT
jgi:hypothetical protein